MKNFKKHISIFIILILVLIIIGLVVYIFYQNNLKENNEEIAQNKNSKTEELTDKEPEAKQEDEDESILDYNELYEEEFYRSEDEYFNENIYGIKDHNFFLDQDNTYNLDDEHRGMKLLEYDNSNKDFAQIYYTFSDYTTDPSYRYLIEINDENGKSLFYSGKKQETMIGGMISVAKIEKVDLSKKIVIKISEKFEPDNIIEKSAELELDLSKDLEKKVKIDQSKDETFGKIGDVTFKYIYDQYVYFGTTSHAYSEKLRGENCSIPVKAQYGNKLMSGEHIEFSCEKNVNDLSAEEAFNALKIINYNFGQYGLSDIYSLSITNSDGEIIEEVIVSFDEMLDLCNGLTIEKNGKTYTKDSFEKYAEMRMTKDGVYTIGNGIKAIKYHFEPANIDDEYMFVYKDNIYYVRLPKNVRIESAVQDFLDNLELE